MGGSSTPQPPPKTPEEIAMEKRTALGLKQERAKTERRLKAQARSQLGAKSLLRGIKPKSNEQESVVHSKAISSEVRDYLAANTAGKLGMIDKLGTDKLGLSQADVKKVEKDKLLKDAAKVFGAIF